MTVENFNASLQIGLLDPDSFGVPLHKPSYSARWWTETSLSLSTGPARLRGIWLMAAVFLSAVLLNLCGAAVFLPFHMSGGCAVRCLQPFCPLANRQNKK
jgi:hypothetical protein